MNAKVTLPAEVLTKAIELTLRSSLVRPGPPPNTVRVFRRSGMATSIYMGDIV